MCIDSFINCNFQIYNYYLAKNLEYMSGIYFHIPFCKQLCNYCDFHKNISLSAKEDMLECLKKELEQRNNYLRNRNISTIYFGGGTPSVYLPQQIQELIDTTAKYFSFADNMEITMEANPDDLTPGYLQELQKTAINRLSMGIQSLHADDLKLMNRRHSDKEAIIAVRNAQKYGFSNISVDLIYGVPGLTMQKWKENLSQIFSLNIQHISAYHLMIEQGTVFAKRVARGKLSEVEEELSIQQFKLLIEKAKENGFEHYEISNFCKKGMHSQHNLAYWQQKAYLGIGPSAHSYNLYEREWNISNNNKYMKAVINGGCFSEKEELSSADKFNDLVLTALRTSFGLNLKQVKLEFGEKIYNHCKKIASKHIKSENIRKENDTLILTDKGVFVSNDVMSDFFWIED